MAYQFPSEEWLLALKDKLNSDEQYAEIAKKWEGDLMFRIEPGGPVTETMELYADLWHGKCRQAFIVNPAQRAQLQPAFTLTASYENLFGVIAGKIDPMQAMITRKLKVQGSMAYMMRNVPVVLDFVRCAQEIETKNME